MDEHTVLAADHVSRIFARERKASRKRLGGELWRAALARPYDACAGDLRPGEFYAVDDVSVSLRRGEALGLVGPNGSGKTTLLRLLAGQLLPDRGRIAVRGSTASMIDLTAGFHAAASGRENIFLRGAALGRPRARMLADYDRILAFSELGDAIEAPLTSYSSGMVMRLAFSIVTAEVPDILFIDEVLSVGDDRFRRKCLARMRAMQARSALVIVSHNLSEIARHCDRAMVMRRGQAVFEGASADAVEFYGKDRGIESRREAWAGASA